MTTLSDHVTINRVLRIIYEPEKGPVKEQDTFKPRVCRELDYHERLSAKWWETAINHALGRAVFAENDIVGADWNDRHDLIVEMYCSFRDREKEAAKLPWDSGWTPKS